MVISPAETPGEGGRHLLQRAEEAEGRALLYGRNLSPVQFRECRGSRRSGKFGDSEWGALGGN